MWKNLFSQGANTGSGNVGVVAAIWKTVLSHKGCFVFECIHSILQATNDAQMQLMY